MISSDVETQDRRQSLSTSFRLHRHIWICRFLWTEEPSQSEDVRRGLEPWEPALGWLRLTLNFGVTAV